MGLITRKGGYTIGPASGLAALEQRDIAEYLNNTHMDDDLNVTLCRPDPRREAEREVARIFGMDQVDGLWDNRLLLLLEGV